MDMPNDLTFKEAIKLVRESDDICHGRLCSKCPLDREGDKCLGCVVPTPSQLKRYESDLIDLKIALDIFKEVQHEK